jgi:CubicO group peptidase (beta-lactamase class C family)
VTEGRSDPRFDAVRDAFATNFTDHGEVGAACAVVVGGEVVVDVWGGHMWADGPRWAEDTMVETRSTVKGVTALLVHLLIDRGVVELDAPVRRWWPELRADPLVHHALSHSAGIPVVDAPLPDNGILEWDVIRDAIAVQQPEWEPGARHGYHGLTFGWLLGEVIRRATGTTVGQFLQQEVSGPLGVDYFIGTPASEHARVAPLLAPPPPPPGERATSFMSTLDPTSLAARMYAPVLPPIAPNPNSPEFRSAEIPVTNGIGTARALATIYGELARGGGRLVQATTVEAARSEQFDGTDAVLGIPARRALGYELTPHDATDGRPAHAFGHPGAGGSIAFADVDAGIGFAYVMNQIWGGGMERRDPRAASLIRATYESLAK